MTLKVGELQADITGDTSGLDAAEKKATQIYNKIEREASSAEKANKSFWGSFGGAKEVKRDLKELESQEKKTTSAGAGMGRGIGQLGIQVGQFAGMVQGGSNALLAFSYQASDMAIVLGMMIPRFAAIAGIVGAVISVSSALAGSLIPSLFKSKTAVDQLQDSTKKLGEVAKIVGNDGLVVLTEKVAKLAEESENAAKAMISGGILDAMDVITKAAKQTKKEVNSAFKDLLTDPKIGRTAAGIGDVEIKIDYEEFALKKLERDFKLTRTEAEELRNAMKQLVDRESNESVQRMQDVLDSLSTKSGRDQIVRLSNKLRDVSLQSEDANKKLLALKGFERDLPRAATQTDVIGGVDPAERIKAIEQLGETERQTIKREYAEREQLILAATQLTEDKRNELLTTAANFRDAQLAEITKREQDAAQKEIDQKTAKIEAIKQLDETERDRVMREFAERKNWINEQTQLGEDELTELIVSARNKRDNELQKIRDREVAAEERKNQQIQQNFQSQMQAMQGMTTAIGNIIDVTGKSGAQRFASLLAGVSQMTMQIVTMMQAQATAQAAGDPTAVTLPQKMANVAMIGSMFAGIISMMSSAKGGGRQHGGPTSGNLVHEVNERGPELLTMGNRQYLMPTGQNGRVTPMQSAKSGKTEMKVTVINNASNASVSTEQVSAEEIRLYVDSKVQEINSSLQTGRGETAKNLQQGFQVKRRLT